jgi:hypothetical protein
MNREDVLKANDLKAELSDSFRTFERSMVSVFGNMVYALDTVIDRHNTLERQQSELRDLVSQLQQRVQRLEGNGHR